MALISLPPFRIFRIFVFLNNFILPPPLRLPIASSQYISSYSVQPCVSWISFPPPSGFQHNESLSDHPSVIMYTYTRNRHPFPAKISTLLIIQSLGLYFLFFPFSYTSPKCIYCGPQLSYLSHAHAPYGIVFSSINLYNGWMKRTDNTAVA